MASLKRKYDEIGESDSDEPSFGKQILPVADLPDDFDGEPTDGMQYLFTVRRDAKALPQFTRVANPYESFPESSPSNPTRRKSHSALPSEEWRKISETRWRNIHKNFNQPTIGTSFRTPQRKLMPDKNERDLWWEFLAGGPESVWSQSRPSKRKSKARQLQQHEMFAEGKMRAWDDKAEDDISEEQYESGQIRECLVVDQTLVLGESATFNMAVNESETGNAFGAQDSLPTPTGTPTPPGFATETSTPTTEERIERRSPLVPAPREPTPHLLKSMDESVTLRLLMYFTFWIHRHLREPDFPNYRITDTHARWMCSLLLRIDAYISADDMNLLRNLARACLAFVKITISERIKGTPPEQETSVEQMQGTQAMREQACWLIISGIVGIWGQKDLWVDAEDALASIG